MSRFLSRETAALEPYTPGEQPQNLPYNKLNTNESPFPPSPRVLKALSRAEMQKLNLYSDPACTQLCRAVAKRCEVQPEQVAVGNGSDELLSFAFRAFCGAGKGCAYPDITYGFYKVWAQYYGLESTVIPLREDFTISVDDYLDFPGTIFLANPNALTGIALPRTEIQRLLEANPDRVVIVDEAYVDFGGESCVPMIFRYDNLLVVQTMSKSRSLAGGRVGFAMGSPELIAALNRVKYSFNPYNVNRLSLVAGTAALEDETYFQTCCASICQSRAWAAGELERLGFTVLPSRANFLFVRSPKIGGEDLYRSLKENGILVRWFDSPRIRDFVRITVGDLEQMHTLIDQVEQLLDTL